MSTHRVASPAATGGEGTFFEQHVNAYWLAQLLVQAVPPIFLRATITEVSFQTEHLGWATDDVLIAARTGSGELRRLAGQMKKSLSVAASNDDFNDAITDAWTDFSNTVLFARDRDALVLITQMGTTALLKHFVSLLDTARASPSAEDFERRLTTTGFVHAQVRTQADEVRKVVEKATKTTVCLVDLWPFLRALYVISFDLNTPTSQTEASVKALLAHASSEQDRAGAADATWNALLKEVGGAMPDAKTYARADLPDDVLRRHNPLSDADHRALAALRQHSSVVLENIRTSIGADVHLPRTAVVQSVLEAINSSRLVLVSGPAGSGKSAAAKTAVQSLDDAHYVFGFRAEELARAHLDEALVAAQIPARTAELTAITAAHPKKIVLVESVERLLEASTRDAFSDLLKLVQRDATWRLILTCRDYSVDLVRAAFFHEVGAPTVVNVPPLTDDELSEIQNRHPAIRPLLTNNRLRALLRNPYTLDRATQIDWGRDDELPVTERDFRGKFWRHFVRAEHRREQGMPQRRADTFMELCARRARALALYAPVHGLDPQALAVLEGDGLAVMSPDTDAAPSHDVLEDWGVIEWISFQFAASGGAPTDLAARLGPYPAIRRTYRKWVAELIERDAATADTLFERTITAEVPAHFRDDTVLAFLKSDHVSEVLARHTPRLLADNKRLLHRVIHLLRIGCVKLPEWLPIPHAPSSGLLQPEGVAWADMLQLVQNNLPVFAAEDRPLLMGLVEDWAKSVAWWAPYPPGHEAAAAIAVWLMPSERAMKLLAKIPASAADDVAAALRRRDEAVGDREVQFHNRLVDDFRRLIFDGVDGMAVARDLPDLTIEVARQYMLAEDADFNSDDYYYRGRTRDIESWFGIKEARSHGFFPPSALRGPFRPLLLHHPEKALTFIIELFNHSADWYAHPRIPMRVEPAFEITLTFADGATKAQWCNGRLWSVYRGSSVAPSLLQSAAMALEGWLFEVAAQDVAQVEPLLLRLLRESDSVVLTAVAASIAVAYPQACGETLLALLSSPICVMIDRGRMSSEMSSHFLGGMRLQRDAMSELYADERKTSNAKPHRREDIESAIAKLQLTPLAARVHQAIDAYRGELPPLEEQTEEDQLWRLALHRMDLRGYTVAEATTETLRAMGVSTAAPDESQFVVLSGTVPDSDLQEMVEGGAARHARIGARLGLHMWGIKVFAREESDNYDPAQWRERLAEAMTNAHAHADDGEDELIHFGAEGAGFVAAICVRDHWAELTQDEREWCVQRVCDEVEHGANEWQERSRAAGMEAVPAAASTLPYLSLQQPTGDRVLRAYASALTHASYDVRRATARGVARYFWPDHVDLALRSARGLGLEAAALQRASDAEEQKEYHSRRDHDLLRADAAEGGRRYILAPWEEENDPLLSFDGSEWYGADATLLILTILIGTPDDPLTIAAFGRLTATVVSWWDADDDARGHGPRRSDDTESALLDLVEAFAFRVSSSTTAEDVLRPLLDAVDRHADELRWFMHGLILREDRQPSTERFWFLWQLFADRLRQAPWMARIDDRGVAFLAEIFLAVGWSKNARHWKSLTGHVNRLHRLFEALPISKAVLHQYVRFLYHVGEESLPSAYIRIASKVKAGNPAELLEDSEIVFMLESILQRQVYSKPAELKQREDLRTAVLYLLDQLVDAGSSAAFRMRDDFVTPLPAQ